ncbi:MAG: class I SAM-dependent methyltransferase [Candidatus Acidiferrales bacterium]
MTSDANFGTELALSAKRFASVLKNMGVQQTVSACVSILEDRYLHTFDRAYHVQTGGVIELTTTSVDRSKLKYANVYAPVNAWALRKLLRKLALPESYRFADLGCGLGRPVILAAEYGFSKVTGVDFAPELCAKARENVVASKLNVEQKNTIEIVQGDVMDYCAQTDDDVFFMFRPFSWEFLQHVVAKIAERAVNQSRRVTVIYSERLNLPESFNEAFTQNSLYRPSFSFRSLGQKFDVHQCGPATGSAS